jgi:hypothetical protein
MMPGGPVIAHVLSRAVPACMCQHARHARASMHVNSGLRCRSHEFEWCSTLARTCSKNGAQFCKLG